LIPTSTGRTADFLIDGRQYELKTMTNVSNQTSDGLSKAISTTAMDARGQSGNIIIDARGQPGMTADIAERGVSRAYGRDNVSGQKIKSITVITSEGTVYVPRVK
jgi:filamentous hemagglutinin